MVEILVPEAAEWIIRQLNRYGYEAYVVGGCVRDSLLGRAPKDWDITTNARPAQVKEIFKHTIDTGIQHGTVTVMKDHVGYEVTTYRVDGEYEDGRHPKTVEFTGNLEEDLQRRDFTINAMAYSGESGLVDVFGGAEDLTRRVVRCVGGPSDRFAEDALRILRAIRFSAQLDFMIEEETLHAAAAMAPNLVHVSKERILVELTKLLLSDHPGRIRLLYEMGISPYLSDRFWGMAGTKTDGINRLPKDKGMRWAGFLRDLSGQEAENLCRELKMDNAAIGKVKTLVSLWREEIPVSRPAIRRVMSGLTPERFDELLCFSRTFSGEEYAGQLKCVEEETKAIRAARDCVRLKDLAVNGQDLTAVGMKPGPEMGRMLKELFSLVLDHPEWNTRKRLMELVSEMNRDR